MLLYPMFSKVELLGIRLGGPGLGNLLFIWAHSLVYAKKNCLDMIWPTWPSLKLGPWVRHEKDKRFYGDLFVNQSGHVDGLRKQWLLLTAKKIPADKFERMEQSVGARQDAIVIYDNFRMSFDGLREYRKDIVALICGNLKSKNAQVLDYKADKSINVHIRLGDFSKNANALKQGSNNVRIPIEWYISMIQKVRDVVGCIPVNIFSDGTDQELEQVLVLDKVSRITFGNSISDIIALSKAPLIISSGSSFSLWARFLGATCNISYPGQIKERDLTDISGFEIELDEQEELPEKTIKVLKRIYD